MNYVVYPRGFIGFDAGFVKLGIVEEKKNTNLRSILLNRTVGPDESPHASNTIIDQLWAETTGGRNYTTSFYFRERIIKAALTAFGTQNFYDWCQLQVTNPYAKNSHNKFVNETLSFIASGYRTVDVNTWFNLIDISDDLNRKAVNDIKISEYFRTRDTHNNQRPVSLEHTLVEWTKHQDGFGDLLTTLMLLFGDLA